MKNTNLATALFNFQNECPEIKKDATGYGYKYATLNNIIKTIKPFLIKNKLLINQPIKGNVIQTIVTHVESGEKEVSEFEIIIQEDGNNRKNRNHEIGSAISYARRYSIGAFFNLDINDDDDANVFSKKPIATPKKTTTKKVNVKKPEISDEQFRHECREIMQGRGTIQDLKKSFELSEQQNENLMLL